MELGNAVQLSLQRNSYPYEVANKLPLYFGKERLDVEVSCSNSNINNYTRDIFLQLHKKHSSVLALHFCFRIDFPSVLWGSSSFQQRMNWWFPCLALQIFGDSSGGHNTEWISWSSASSFGSPRWSYSLKYLFTWVASQRPRGCWTVRIFPFQMQIANSFGSRIQHILQDFLAPKLVRNWRSSLSADALKYCTFTKRKNCCISF